MKILIIFCFCTGIEGLTLKFEFDVIKYCRKTSRNILAPVWSRYGNVGEVREVGPYREKLKCIKSIELQIVTNFWYQVGFHITKWGELNSRTSYIKNVRIR